MKSITRYLWMLVMVTAMTVFGQQKSMDLLGASTLDDEWLDQIRARYLSDSKNFMIVQGDYTIKAGRFMDKDVIVVNGDLYVEGTLNGSAVVTKGNIILDSGGEISKNAIVIHGKVIVDNNNQIAGKTMELDKEKSANDTGDKKDIAKSEKVESDETITNSPCDDQITELQNDLQSVNDKIKDLSDKIAKKQSFAAKFDDANIKEKMKLRGNHKKYDLDRDRNNDDNEEADRDEDSDNDQDNDNNGKGRGGNNSENYNYNYNYSYDYQYNNPSGDGNENGGDDVYEVNLEDEWMYVSPHSKYKTGYFAMDYNRVNGLYLGLRMDKEHRIYSDKPFQIYGEFGFAFGNKDWQYQLGVDKFWGNRSTRFTTGGEFHNMTATQDEWLVGNLENAFNAILLKNDYKDYFQTRGYSLHAGQNLNSNLRFTATYTNDQYFSETNHVNWAVFRPSHDFRVNPAINDGRMVTVAGKAELNNVSEYRWQRKITKRRGWKIEAEGERSMKSLNSDFHFTRYTLGVTRYQPLSRWENLDVRVLLGSATGDLPLQKTFYLGGISTLRGHDYKSLGGNQMALVNVEYRMSSGRFHEDRIFFLDPFSLILFMDSGYAWNNKIYAVNNLAQGTSLKDMQTDLGVGFGDESDLFRFDIAKSVSEKGSSYKFNLRLNYAF